MRRVVGNGAWGIAMALVVSLPSGAWSQTASAGHTSTASVAHRGIVGAIAPWIRPMAARAGVLFGALLRPGLAGLAALDATEPDHPLPGTLASLGTVGLGQGRPDRGAVRDANAGLLVLPPAPGSYRLRGLLPPRATTVPRIHRPADSIVEPDMNAVRAIIRRRLAGIRACHEAAVRSGVDVQGRAAVRFVVEPDGSVSAAAMFDADPATQVLRGCVEREVRTWRFDAAADHRFTITYPFVFRTEP